MPDTKPNPEVVANALARGSTIQAAMLEGGYSESSAKRGKAGMSREVRSALAKKLAENAEFSRQFTAEDQEHIVRGSLMKNVIAGKDNSVRSLELLGKDKRVNMFSADNLTGVIVLNVPNSLSLQPASIQAADGEVI